VINVTVNISSAGIYHIYAMIQDMFFNLIDESINSAYLNQGIHIVEIYFMGIFIYNNGVNGPYDVQLNLFDYSWNNIDMDTHNTAGYLYGDFDLPPQPLMPPWFEDFEFGFLPGSTGANWTASIRYMAEVGNQTSQSGSNSMFTRWGFVTVTSMPVNTSTLISGEVRLWIQRGHVNFSDNPEPGNDLTVEYLNETGNWILLETFLGSGTPGEILTPNYVLSQDGLHSNFQLRFTQTSGNWIDQDYWHIDDVYIGPDITDPIADAGPDQFVDEDTNVTFDGSGSTDNVGIDNYTWTFVDGTLQTLYGMNPIYNFSEPDIYNVTLTVRDAAGNSDTDNVTITVNDVTPPIADAGPDRYAGRNSTFTFDGSGSTDNSGIINYTWTFFDGAPKTLYGVNPTYTFRNLSQYNVTLTVRDTVGLTDSDNATITVIIDSTPPIADAGPDQTVDEDTVVTVDGSGSTDNVAIDNYTWTFNDGGPQTLYGVSPTYIFATPGIYNVTLNVTDVANLSDIDYVEITVNDITPPTADAGADQTVGVQTVVSFYGNGSTDNLGIVGYTWTFNDGGTQTLSGRNPSYTFTTTGTYTVTLNVTDAAGNWDTDTVTIVVTADNTPPVANAGADQTVQEGDSVLFNANDSSDNIGIVNYSWTFSVGNETVTLYGVTTTYKFTEAGIYEVTLTVRDAAGLSDTDTITITVEEGKENVLSSFFSDYWWVIVVIIAAIAALVIYMMLRKEKGKKKQPVLVEQEQQTQGEELPLPPKD